MSFPEEIITEILVRLPVKSVLICKSVCKQWLSTISNPHFIKYQLQRAINNPSTLLVIKHHTLQHEKRGTSVTLDLSPVQIDTLVVPSMFYTFRVVGSCNGIVCLGNIRKNAIYLWNPSIRQFKRIDAPLRCKYIYSKLGFGFDPISNDYKVFGVMYKTWSAVMPDVFVYSANADSWRHFQDPVLENFIIFRGSSVVVKGVVYSYSWNKLISFDLHKEVFGLGPLPRSSQKQMSIIFVYEGSVALFFSSDGNGPGFDLWTLDDASHQVSWSKKCSINLITLEYRGPMWPQCYLGAGQFLGLTHVLDEDPIFYYILYNSDKREAKYYGLREKDVLATLQYTDTLVTFDGFQTVEEMPTKSFSRKKHREDMMIHDRELNGKGEVKCYSEQS